jgi:hypothetical protein
MNPDPRSDAPSVDGILRHDWESERDVGILVGLLRGSTTPEQFIYREVELDELWRWLDDELRAERDGERLAALRGMKEHVMRAHDLSAEGEVDQAADELVAAWSRHGERLRA